jgi:hypothetical protein
MDCSKCEAPTEAGITKVIKTTPLLISTYRICTKCGFTFWAYELKEGDEDEGKTDIQSAG